MRFYQNVLVHEERIPRHLLKLLVREVRLAVRNEVAHVVLPAEEDKDTDAEEKTSGRTASVNESVCVSDRPGHSQLDEMHQVLEAVTDGAGLEALALTGVTPGGRRENLQLKCPTVKEQSETGDAEREDGNEKNTRRSRPSRSSQPPGGSSQDRPSL